MVFLGSGGHTGEMLRMLASVPSLPQLRHITFVFSIGDVSSSQALRKFADKHNIDNYSLVELPRARRVGEGALSSVFSTIKSMLFMFSVLPRIEHPPDVLMLNGPGTTVPLALFYTVSNLLGSSTSIFYVESLARVRRLSASGKLCRPLAHRFLVQWPQLATSTGAEYKGILV